MKNKLFGKFMFAASLAATVMLAGVAQADTYFSGTGKLCWVDDTGAVELPDGATTGLISFFLVKTNEGDGVINGWQVNHETHDVNKNGRGTVMGHLELYSNAGVFTDIYSFKTNKPFTSYYIDRAEGRLVAEYTVSGGAVVFDCPEEVPEECIDYKCSPLDPDVPGLGYQSDITGIIYEED